MTNTATTGFFGIPLWLGCLALVALGGVVVCTALLGLYAVRRSAQADLPNVLLGISHIAAALSGMLPWGRPATPPALAEPAPSPVLPGTEATVDSVVLIRDTRVLREGSSRGGIQ
ncbi:hypothetical protein [Streptomyces virginiae]|uniref:hypothetical protein n=1 Tax=Streptomyces virginiae TaxID=1961 RepID=UPI0037BD13B9